MAGIAYPPPVVSRQLMYVSGEEDRLKTRHGSTGSLCPALYCPASEAERLGRSGCHPQYAQAQAASLAEVLYLQSVVQ